MVPIRMSNFGIWDPLAPNFYKDYAAPRPQPSQPYDQESQGLVIGSLLSVVKYLRPPTAHDHCPERPYVELEVPQDARRIVAVSFSAVAHDQGWADVKEEPSFTWFDASVQRPEGRADLRTITAFYNRLANPEYFEQKVRWHLNDGPRRRLWIEALRPGDVIQLTPKAIYIAWVNIVKECSIKIEYESKELHGELNELQLASNAAHYTTSLSTSDEEIRLLHVEPGSFEDPIRGYFSQAKLRDVESHTIDFDALSYFWGDSSDRVDISLVARKDLVDNEAAREAFSIGRTVADALKRFRHQDKLLTIWIDAVCINQENLEERAHQVTLMNQIYSQASTVRIWLGEANPGVQACLSLTRDMYNHNHRYCLGGKGCSCPGTAHLLSLDEIDEHMQSLRNEGQAETFHGMAEIFRLHSKAWSPEIIDLAGWYGNTQLSFLMSVLFENPWFTRVWVIQEALSSSNALVHCSGEQVPWEELIEVNSWLGRTEFKLQNPHITSQTIMAPIWKALKPKGTTNSLASPIEAQPTSELSSILDVFLAGLDLKATDPRDKLFALLTFADETHVSGKLDELIRPNYDKSAQRVFADFTRWWIREHGSLSILSTVHCHPDRTWQRTLASNKIKNTSNKPTWAISSEGRSRWARASLVSQFKFSAAGETRPDVELLNTSDSLVLRLSGHRVSEIAAISHAPIEYIYPYAHDNGERSDISAVFDKIFDPCGFTEFWTFKSIDNTKDNTVKNARNKYIDHVRAHWLYAEHPKLQALKPSGSPEKEWYETDKLPTCCEPCFFVASDGRFGLCPWGSKEGDVIVLLHGGKVPYLLRPAKGRDADSTFELVGECFVEGIMHGELFQLYGDNAGFAEIFDLV
ncbi:hypothetical protein FZEAL_3890 [Fusarium zealandicum]|uniref:Heterokaryon incompatibility domain-containing protein n=1 Tax=Fusarium zealandicum TaxID=1053134 RepID=A0A8H4UNP4_9HYPO|nr:hypothetical protein FZEAL_3890 [Fusarium zealandicum]